MTDLAIFRRCVGEWIDAHAPPGIYGQRAESAYDGYWGGQKSADPGPDRLRWLEVMRDKRWIAPSWPSAYGGGGLSPVEGQIIKEEIQVRQLPPPLVGIGLMMLGPVILARGTEAQKRTHLSRICDGSVRWCQGYSEPSSGSDLASLRTRAVLDGDHFIVDGQKVWTSFADVSDWIFCLVRSDATASKHGGISFLLMDMNTPGVSARRIKLISGASPFCETFFDGVRVPVENMIGEMNDGWGVAKSVLHYERSTIGTSIAQQMEKAEHDLVAMARTRTGVDTGPLPDAYLREQIARTTMRSAGFALTSERLSKGEPGLESSILKVIGTELKQRRAELAAEILGPRALGWEDESYTEEELRVTTDWLRNRANTIEGGTTEIQLNIIARRVLGLR